VPPITTIFMIVSSVPRFGNLNSAEFIATCV
jgi:hypothetical protein